MESNCPLISVIVPVYNVKDYLRKCLDSICAQTYRNLEILVVDDGSTDGSGAICDEYAKKDERINVIHQKNGGLSAARNSALDVAKGEYVGFIDSDDWIDPGMFECLYETLVGTNVAISACSYYEDKGGKSVPHASGGDVYTLHDKEAMRELVDDRTFRVMVWNKLFKSDLFEGIRFPVGRTNEDVAVMYRLFAKSGGVSYVVRPFYHYVTREGSIMGNNFYNAKVELDYFIARMERSRFLRTYDLGICIHTLKYLVRDGVKLIDRAFLDTSNPDNSRIIETCVKELSTINMRDVPFYLGVKGWLVTRHLGAYRKAYMAFRKLFKSKKKFKKQ